MKKTIGFFGDSFCAEEYNKHSISNGYKSYVEMLANHFDAKIVNLGKGGSSIYDTILIQLNPFIQSNTIPDICVFVWANAGRLYNRQVRRITHKSAYTYESNLLNILEQNIWKAARFYYDYLYDHEKEELEYISLLNYIDTNILNKLPPTTKVIHLWSTGNPEWHNKDFRPSVVTYPYNFKIGVEVRPALVCVSLCDSDQSKLHHDIRCNHLDGQFKNDLVFDWILQAIDGKTLDHSQIIEPMFNNIK